MSRPRVTITLGRSGQVVKNSSPMVDGSDYVTMSGTKRPMSERLGANNYLASNKRFRAENGGQRLNINDDICRDDLRYKLMRKGLSAKRSEHDLREKLLGTTQPSMRYRNTQMHPPDSKSSRIFRRIPPTRSADDLLHLESKRTHSSREFDGLRHRSPDRIFSYSREEISPPISRHDFRLKSAMPYNASPTLSNSYKMNNLMHSSRETPSNSYAMRSMTEASRPKPSNSYAMKSMMDASRSGTLMNRSTAHVVSDKYRMGVAPASIGVNRSSRVGKAEEPVTVATFLHSLGLGKYAILFQAEEVDMHALRQMGETDLKELGIPMGPRKKILQALTPRTRRHV